LPFVKHFFRVFRRVSPGSGGFFTASAALFYQNRPKKMPVFVHLADKPAISFAFSTKAPVKFYANCRKSAVFQFMLDNFRSIE
jgi:hypothetical protein